MVIDFHTHTFPQNIAEKAIPQMKRRAGNIPAFYDGGIDGLREYVKASPADKAVVLNIATNPKQQKAVNDFAISANSDVLSSFGSVHPNAPDALEELHRLKQAGLKGIKLHPDYQQFVVDDERMLPIYETIVKLQFVLVFHAGVDIGYPLFVHCPPKNMANALQMLKGAKAVVAAHMGGSGQWYEVEEFLVGKEIYFDTAHLWGRMPPALAKRIIQNHGANKVLFGSDLPWGGIAEEISFVESLDLPQGDFENILGNNAEKLLF